ncbi:aquaglyceroporin, putative [Plasmodium relictum]|uniref:Aquaglyceroporin, putative n=1 Tax=Plasmodium relictum TaxID=85471 RepID=A0A1J1H5L5_PLARL|nr:aquaglyceroporin, putative [Plasmodium relictum]CRH00200.1 aquaglyceroporin, putative [Plasmodium relictum]
MQIQPYKVPLKEFLGEFLGTFVLMFFGEGATANYYTVGASNDWLKLCLGWSLGVFFGILVSAKLSGAHLNLAVTLGLSSIKKFEYKKVPIYFLGQILGALLGTFTVYRLFYGFVNANQIPKFAWETGRNKLLSLQCAFMNEFLLTGLLLLVILVVIDENICGKFHVLKVSTIVGLTILCIGISFGGNTGFALNPSRDLGARILSFLAYGSQAFSGDHFYFWIPFIAPILGATVFCQFYDKIICPLLDIPSSEKDVIDV